MTEQEKKQVIEEYQAEQSKKLDNVAQMIYEIFETYDVSIKDGLYILSRLTYEANQDLDDLIESSAENLEND